MSEKLNTNTSITDIRHNPESDLELCKSFASCIVCMMWFCHDFNESIEINISENKKQNENEATYQIETVLY